MTQSGLSKEPCPPLVIGGVGGSGTRLIAQCLKALGYFMGGDLNRANDNLWFTLLFKRVEVLSLSDAEFENLVDIFVEGSIGLSRFTSEQVELITALALEGRAQHTSDWLAQRATSLLLQRNGIASHALWGWKEPNTHVILDRLLRKVEGLKYIHVVRNGLDMAYSDNQNQLNLWGECFLNEPIVQSPYFSLRYWCVAHQRVISIGETMGDNFMLLNYDDFCLDPLDGVQRLCSFLGLSAEGVSELIGLVHPPKSIGRFRESDINQLSEVDIAYVESLGFEVI